MTEEYLIKVVTERILNKDYKTALRLIELEMQPKALPKNFEEDVIITVCFYCKITKLELLERTRKMTIVDARKLVSKILRDRNYTFSAIGKLLGNIHHASIIHYCRSAENLITTDKVFRTSYEDIVEIINQKN
jgi:chromosomal replication initiation ATPase DnaA